MENIHRRFLSFKWFIVIICSCFRPIVFDHKMILNDLSLRTLKQSWPILKHSQRVCLEEEQCGKFSPNFENWTYKILTNNNL